MVAVHAIDNSVEVTSTNQPLIHVVFCFVLFCFVIFGCPFFLYGPRFLFLNFPQGFGHVFLPARFCLPHVWHIQFGCRSICFVCHTIVDNDCFVVDTDLFVIGGISIECVIGPDCGGFGCLETKGVCCTCLVLGP